MKLFAKFQLYCCLWILEILSVSVAAISCTSNEQLDKQLSTAEQIMNEHPDSALTLLQNIDTTTLDSKREKARYALLISMALDKNYIDTTTFSVLQPAIDFYLKKGTPDEKLRTSYYRGRIYQNRGEKDMALKCFIQGREFGSEATDTLTLANLLVAQGGIYYSTYKYIEFIKSNLEAARLYELIGKTEYELLSLANVLDGSIIRKDKKLADSIMNAAKDRVRRHPDLNSILTKYNLEYALEFGSKEDIINILDYYNSQDSINDNVKLNIAVAYDEIGDWHNAKKMLDSISENSSERHTLKYLATKPDILKHGGDVDGAYNAYHDYSCEIDSINRYIFSNDLLFIKQRHELEKARLIELRHRDMIIWASLCSLFVLMIVAGFIYYRYRLGKEKIRLDEQEKQKLLLEQENLRYKIDNLENESATLRKILEKRDTLAQPVEDVIKERLELLNGLLAAHISENEVHSRRYKERMNRMVEDRSKFVHNTRLAFTASHPGFIDYLELHGLTDKEINYMCLYALGLSSKELGEYINTSNHYHVNSEIRRKLGIDSRQTNLTNYIRKLMQQQ